MNTSFLDMMNSEIDELTAPKVKGSKVVKTRTFTRSRKDDPIGHDHYSMVVFRRNGFVNRTDTTDDSPEVLIANLAIVQAVEWVNDGHWRMGDPSSIEVEQERERCKSTAVKDTVYTEVLTEVLFKRVTLDIDASLTDAESLTVRSRWIATRLAKRKLFPVNPETNEPVKIVAIDGLAVDPTDEPATEETATDEPTTTDEPATIA